MLPGRHMEEPMMHHEAVKVLLVEDNPGDALLVRMLLEEVGGDTFVLLHAERLDEAIGLLTGEDFDVVLLDLSLPDSHGLETIVRARAAARRVPMVVLSGLDDEERALQALQSGAEDYLVKGQGDASLMARSIRYAIERKKVEDGLRQSEERFRRLVDNAADAFFAHDIDGRLVDVNQHACYSLGYTREELLSLSVQDIEEALTPVALKELWEGLRSGPPETVEGVHRRKDGTTFPIEARLTPFEMGGQLLTLALCRDVTERKQAEHRLEESEQRYKSLFDHNPDAVFSLDLRGNFITVNSVCSELSGYGTEELPGMSIASLIAPEDLERTMQHFKNAALGEPQNYEISVICKAGHRVEVNVTNSPIITGGEMVGVYGIAKDVTERKRAEEQMSYLARYDHLTGLSNRNLFQDRLTQALARADRDGSMVALMFLDLDRFKPVNDTLGHGAGDLLLKAVASRLKGMLRETDTIARMGGDEFAIILEDITDAQDVGPVASKILEAIAQPFTLNGHEVFVTASIGIAVRPPSEGDVMVKEADTAMYRAKDLGRGRRGRGTYQFYTREMNTRISERLILEGGLRRALAREQLFLHYQPQVDLATGEIVGAEALLRWQHPTLGLVPPGEFIPVLEDIGLIVEVGEWVLRTACSQARAWQADGFEGLRMAVNLSARQFVQEDLVGSVTEVLVATGLDPRCLELEITEGLLSTLR